MTVSHAIVILLILTCQLTPKSNSHISQSFVASVYKPAFFQCLFNPVSCTVQQCIQISTRINSSSVHTYIFVCSTLRVILIQGFVDPIMQHIVESLWKTLVSSHQRDIWVFPKRLSLNSVNHDKIQDQYGYQRHSTCNNSYIPWCSGGKEFFTKFFFLDL